MYNFLIACEDTDIPGMSGSSSSEDEDERCTKGIKSSTQSFVNRLRRHMNRRIHSHQPSTCLVCSRQASSHRERKISTESHHTRLLSGKFAVSMSLSPCHPKLQSTCLRHSSMKSQHFLEKYYCFLFFAQKRREAMFLPTWTALCGRARWVGEAIRVWIPQVWNWYQYRLLFLTAGNAT